ncbi:MAG: CopG family transcriptional regulator, partial [Puniceicoccales bacterium]
MPSNFSSPLTFEVDEQSFRKLEALVSKTDAKNLSQVIRIALKLYDYSKFQADVSETRQLSVRLDPELRDQVAKVSKENKASFGEVLRAALDALSKKPLREVVRETKKTDMAKKTAKKTAKKAAKKVSRKAAKKAPAKKAAKKAVRKATKKAAKKATKKVA